MNKDPFYKLRKDVELATIAGQKWARKNRESFDRLFKKEPVEEKGEEMEKELLEKMEMDWLELKNTLIKKGYTEKEIHNFYCAFKIGWVQGECHTGIKNINLKYELELNKKKAAFEGYKWIKNR